MPVLLPSAAGNSQIGCDQSLDNEHVPPDAVQAAVLFVCADLPESERSDEGPAGRVLREYTGDQLPEARPLGCEQQFAQRQAARATAAIAAIDIHRSLRDTVIAGAVPVAERCGEGD